MTDPSGQAKRCPNPACRLEETNLCVDGLAIEDCPHLNSELRVRIGADTNDVFSGVRIHRGSTFDPLSCNDILAEHDAGVVAVVGPPDAGKTSLIAAVYDALLYDGCYRKIRFSQSLSLPAFEKICHKTRMSSRAARPTTDRTPIADKPSFYHLALTRSGGATEGFLIADRSGEMYQEIGNFPDRARDFIELTRARVINVLVDGEALVSPERRSAAVATCRQAVTALSESRAVRVGTPLNVVLTKVDLVVGSDQEIPARTAFANLHQALVTRGRDVFGSVHAFEIAAVPVLDTAQRAHGIETLVSSWFGKKPSYPPFDGRRTTGGRSFELFQAAERA